MINRTYNTAYARVRPDEGGLRMTPEQRFHRIQIGGRLVGIGKRSVDVVVNNGHKTNFFSEVQHAIHGGIEQTGNAARDFVRDEFLVEREFTDTTKHAGKHLQYAADVIRRIHVRGIETGDERIKSLPL